MTERENERIAKLEERLKNVERKQDEQAAMLREVRDAIISARGAKLALVSLIALSGTIGGLISQFFPR